MTREEFEVKWHQKLIRYIGDYWKIPKQEYVVSAALYQQESEDVTILGLYRQIGDGFFTIRMGQEQVEQMDKNFEIVFKELKLENKHEYKDGQIFTLNIDLPTYDLSKGFVRDAMHDNTFAIKGWVKSGSPVWLDQVIEGHLMFKFFGGHELDHLCCHMPVGYVDKELTYMNEYIDFDGDKKIHKESV